MYVKMILAFAISLLVSLILMKIFIPVLRKVKLGQTILEVGPTWHKSKQGTPVMGGLFFISAVVISLCIMFITGALDDTGIFFAINLCMMLLNAAIGFIDDYVKLFKKRNKGLSAWQKMLLQLMITALYLGALVYFEQISTIVILPFSGNPVDLGIFYYIIAMLVIVYIINCANLTDGIDGLAGSVGIIIATLCLILGIKFNITEIYMFEAALIGAVLGFLIFNFHPAKIFMGDMGSLFLGAALVSVLMRLDAFFLLLIAGFIYIIEGLSVILQVFSYKLTKKRIFKMAPIHHHFEMCGWSEVKIVGVFSFLTVIFCALTYYLYTLNF